MTEDLNKRLSLAMRPFGTCRVRRSADEDSFEVTLFNPQTGICVAEKFFVEALHPAERIVELVVDNFPRVLARAWAYEQDRVLKGGK